jgi:2-keto-4-pentenoate hydratase
MTAEADRYEECAARLRRAMVTQVPCAPVRDLLAGDDVSGAYRVQQLNVAVSGRRRVGRKIGLTSEAVQRQLGVSSPDFGTLLDDMVLSCDGQVPADQLLQPKVEGEIAMVLAAGLDGPAPITAERARDAVAYLVPAIEIVDSRIAGWDISFVDTVADNASSGLAVLGANRTPLADLDLRPLAMSLALNGTSASAGTGADCLGDPLDALAWLANAVRELGDPLLAGEVVLTGALGPMVTVGAGDVVDLEITGLGTARTIFGRREETR